MASACGSSNMPGSRLPALVTDAAAALQKERAISREFHDAGVAIPMSVRDPNVAIGRHEDIRGPVEVGLVTPEHTRFPQAHDDLTLLIELVHLVTQTPSIAGLCPPVTIRRALRDPEGSLMV